MKKIKLVNVNGDPIGNIELTDEVIDTIVEIRPDISLSYSWNIYNPKHIICFGLVFQPAIRGS